MLRWGSLIFSLWLLSSNHAQGQEGKKYDFLNYHPLNGNNINSTYLLGDSTRKDYLSGIKPVFAFDNRLSFLTNPQNEQIKQVSMQGLKLGLEFYDQYRFGFGYYIMKKPAQIIVQTTQTDTFSTSVHFNYSTIFMEYVLYQDFRWEVSIPLQLGTGRANLRLFSQALDSTLFDSTYAMPVMSIGANAHYKILPWVGVGVGVGYRQLLVPGKEANQIFSTPFFGFKLKIFLGDLYRSVFKPDVIKQRREEYNRMRRERHMKKQKKREAKQKENDKIGS